MNSPLISILVLAAIALFLILRLRSVLGTRDGFENTQAPQQPQAAQNDRRNFEVIEGGPDRDITDNVAEDSDAADAFAQMKRVEPQFSVAEFIQGARAAYEMIVMGFENGSLNEIEPFLAEDVFETFVSVVADREDKGLKIEAEFVGVRDIEIMNATFDKDSNLAEVTVRFVGELTSVVRDAEGQIIEGSPNTVKRQKDTWSFERVIGSDDPSWLLTATDV